MEIIHTNDSRFDELWARGVSLIPGATIFYTPQFRKYERYMFSERIVADDSFVVYSPSKEVMAIVPLYAFRKADERVEYSYASGPEYLRGPLIAAPVNGGVFGKIVQLIVDHISELAIRNKIDMHMVMLEPMELLEGRHYCNYLLEYGYADTCSVDTVIDCSLSEEQLWSDLRKSYRPLINREKRTSKVIVVDQKSYNFDLCEEYRRMHALAAGRVTRPPESFYEMYKLIESDNAFLILVCDEAGQTKGAYYFLFHHDYAFYGSAATDPALSNQSGVGHLGLWQGILTARVKGCRFLDLGHLLSRPEGISTKEYNIDLFKRGFGGKRVVVFRGQRRFVSC